MSYAKKRESTRRWREANPEAAAEVAARFRQKHRERLNDELRARYALMRTRVFNHYGWTCACCGTAKSPTVDHIGGGGRQHREELCGHNASGTALYRWLVRNDFPAGFQTLCRPCNRSKGTGAACRIDHGSSS